MADNGTGAPPPDGAAFSFRDKQYLLPRLTQDDRKAFAIWAAARASQNVADMEPMIFVGVLKREKWAKDVLDTQRHVQAGHFWWDESGGWANRMTDEGHAYICWLCMTRLNKDIPLSLVREMVNAEPDPNGVGLLWRKYGEANSDPLALRPPAEKAGGGSTTGSPASEVSPANASAA